MSDFELFRTIYPRKTGSWAKARESWDKADADPKDIIEGLRLEINNWIAEEVEPKFIPMAATWLNQERWIGGMSIDIVGLSKKPYTEWNDSEWKFALAGGIELSDHARTFLPSHLRLRQVTGEM